MKRNNVIQEKSYAFAIRIVKLSQFLTAKKGIRFIKTGIKERYIYWCKCGRGDRWIIG